MVNKRRSGHQEEKLRNKLADRPGQLKISNWFKESHAPDHSDSVESNKNDNVTDDSNEESDQDSFTANSTPTLDNSNSVEPNSNGNVENDSSKESDKDSFAANSTPTLDNSNSVEPNSNGNVANGSSKDSEGICDQGSCTGSEEIEYPPLDGESVDIRHEANEAQGKLSLQVLLANNDCLEYFTKNSSGRKRPFILCKVCRDFEDVARKHSSNKLVPFANGIVVDCQQKLVRVVDHLGSAQHKEAMLAKRNQELWKARSDRHEWRKYLTKENEYLVQELTKMAVDVYNDSLHGTLPCFNWVSRSLACKRGEQLVKYFGEKGFDVDIPPFEITDKILRYRNPSGYNEMLQIIANIEMQKIIERINKSVCYAIQIDGSVDRTQSDNKFTTLRFIESDGTIQSIFLEVSSPEQNGAHGLLEAVLSAIKKLIREKLASLTTDGESANTGPDEGLWKLLEDELGRKILTMWCTCHRSDLALEDMEDEVSGIKLWKSNAIACATYFRTSKNRTKFLGECAKSIGIDALAFPAHNEIRFAEHGKSLLKAIIRNLPACRKVWSKIAESTTYDYTRKDRLTASTFLNTWNIDSLQFKLTAFMHDVYDVFTSLQKGLQKSYLVLPDILTLRDGALRKFDVIIKGPFPGGEEEKSLKTISDKNPMILSSFFSSSSNKRSEFQEIRDKVARSSKDFLSQRLNIEQENSIQLMKDVLSAKTCATFIHHSVNALKLFIRKDDEEKINVLVNDICEQWPVLESIPHLETSDVGLRYSDRLRQMFVKSRGQLQWLLGAFAVTSPHSMNTERAVSHFNSSKTIHQENYELERVSQRLNISLNCVGTAYFDPRPAVIAFLEKKERRFRPADTEIYQTHDFTKKFFRKESTV